MQLKQLVTAIGCAGFILSSINVATAADGEAIYKAHCAMCHDAGVSGAPKPSDAAAWQSRGDMNTLIQTALTGKGAIMLPKGGCTTCSDDDIKAAVEFMRK